MITVQALRVRRACRAERPDGLNNFFPLDSQFFSAYYFAPLRHKSAHKIAVTANAARRLSCGSSFLTGW